MNRLRLVSITNPDSREAANASRLSLLADTDVTLLSPDAHDVHDRTGAVRRFHTLGRGHGRNKRFPSLIAALAQMQPDVVHLQADPDSHLALQLSYCCRRNGRLALLLDTDIGAVANGRLPGGMISALRARRTLSRTQALIARNPAALAAMRRLGFTGFGVVAGRGLEPISLPDRTEAYRSLELPTEPGLVLGWAGPLDRRSGIFDALEALAISDDVILVIPTAGPGHEEVVDRADALEILHRVRFLDHDRDRAVPLGRPDITAYPPMLAAIDALVLAPAHDALNHVSCLRSIEVAQTHGLPLIHAGSADVAALVGRSGWAVPIRDPGLFAQLLAELRARPALLLAAAQAARTYADGRHSPQAAAVDLGFAIQAAHQSRRLAQAPADPVLLPSCRQQVSRT